MQYRDAYSLFYDRPTQGGWYAMGFRSFLAFVDAHTVCCDYIPTNTDHIECADNAVAAGIVFG